MSCWARSRRGQFAPRRLRSILRASDLVLASLSWLAALAISGVAFGASWALIAGVGIFVLLALGGARGSTSPG